MIETWSRRLRVRDDGTGQSRDIDGTFAEFATEDAIILLGDPGMGKTTFFHDVGNTDYKTVRNFLIDPSAPVGEALFLELAVVPYPDRGALDAVVERRLFISPEVDRFKPSRIAQRI